MSEFPRFVCRPGTTEDAWGYRIDAGSADSPEALESMLADGWYLLPGDWEREDGENIIEMKRRGRPPKQQVA